MVALKILVSALLTILFSVNIAAQCTHPIFCSEPILHAIAKANIFKDSKSFVDLTLKIPIDQALKIFKTANITTFVQKCFMGSDQIFEPVTFSDNQPFPQNFKNIKDAKILEFALQLNKRWNDLGRKVVLNSSKPDNTCKQSCTSFIPEMDNKQIIIPGGRFKEAYYWDSYWIIKGLIVCGMYNTAHKLLENFAIMITSYGFIPNGFRLYYLNRSQPPFFFLMVKQLIQALSKKGQFSKAIALEKYFFPILIQQNNYWMKTHLKKVSINGRTFQMNQYRANTDSPRPESYREDQMAVLTIDSQIEKRRVLKSFSSIAESGWDFSTRWFEQPSYKNPLIDSLIPSDLNTLLGLQQSYLASLCGKYGRLDLLQYYLNKLSERKQYFKLIKRQNRFPDYNFDKIDAKLNSIYPSDYYPYLLYSQQIQLSEIYAEKINPVSSKINSSMQWDSPNVWSPNSWILHQVLIKKQAQKIAFQWVKTVYCSWKNQGNIYQKYRFDEFGKRGEGGQYQVQTGFGWTNGLVLYYLSLYGDTIAINDCL